jgi:condensin complex subunit 1
MLHLIWSKDNNSSTSEDGKELKGVRSRLLECYRSLYFDALPDMEAKQQVNRIAKNMIEYVYPPRALLAWCGAHRLLLG